VEKVEVNDAQIEPFLPAIYKKLDWLSREDLIKHFVSVEFNRFLTYYKNTPDLNVASGDEERKRTPKDQFLTFKINVGFEDGINPPRMIGLINEQTQTRNIEVGRIEIGRTDSFFEIDKNFKDLILKSFQKAFFEGVSLTVKMSENRPREKSKFRANDRPKPKFRSEERQQDKPRSWSNDRPKYKSDERQSDKPKAWESDLSNDWSKGKSKGKSKEWVKDKPKEWTKDKPKEWTKDKPKSKPANRSKDSFGGGKKKRSPYKNW
jgi:ATP-dependent RNA helicase DeaD